MTTCGACRTCCRSPGCVAPGAVGTLPQVRSPSVQARQPRWWASLRPPRVRCCAQGRGRTQEAGWGRLGAFLGSVPRASEQASPSIALLPSRASLPLSLLPVPSFRWLPMKFSMSPFPALLLLVFLGKLVSWGGCS